MKPLTINTEATIGAKSRLARGLLTAVLLALPVACGHAASPAADGPAAGSTAAATETTAAGAASVDATTGATTGAASDAADRPVGQAGQATATAMTPSSAMTPAAGTAASSAAPRGGASADADGTTESAERPSLAGLALGMSRGDAEAALGGPAADSYALPEGGASVELCEYDGVTVGYDASDEVVYVELASAAIPSGFEDVSVGTPVSAAARALALKPSPASAELTREIADGILRLDIDRTTDTVVAMKLIGQALL